MTEESSSSYHIDESLQTQVGVKTEKQEDQTDSESEYSSSYIDSDYSSSSVSEKSEVIRDEYETSQSESSHQMEFITIPSNPDLNLNQTLESLPNLQQEASKLLQQAAEFLQNSDVASALQTASQAQRICPRLVAVYDFLAECYTFKDDKRAAAIHKIAAAYVSKSLQRFVQLLEEVNLLFGDGQQLLQVIRMIFRLSGSDEQMKQFKAYVLKTIPLSKQSIYKLDKWYLYNLRNPILQLSGYDDFIRVSVGFSSRRAAAIQMMLLNKIVVQHQFTYSLEVIVPILQQMNELVVNDQPVELLNNQEIHDLITRNNVQLTEAEEEEAMLVIRIKFLGLFCYRHFDKCRQIGTLLKNFIPKTRIFDLVNVLLNGIFSGVYDRNIVVYTQQKLQSLIDSCISQQQNLDNITYKLSISLIDVTIRQEFYDIAQQIVEQLNKFGPQSEIFRVSSTLYSKLKQNKQNIITLNNAIKFAEQNNNPQLLIDSRISLFNAIGTLGNSNEFLQKQFQVLFDKDIGSGATYCVNVFLPQNQKLSPSSVPIFVNGDGKDPIIAKILLNADQKIRLLASLHYIKNEQIMKELYPDKYHQVYEYGFYPLIIAGYKLLLQKFKITGFLTQELLVSFAASFHCQQCNVPKDGILIKNITNTQSLQNMLLHPDAQYFLDQINQHGLTLFLLNHIQYYERQYYDQYLHNKVCVSQRLLTLVSLLLKLNEVQIIQLQDNQLKQYAHQQLQLALQLNNIGIAWLPLREQLSKNPSDVKVVYQLLKLSYGHRDKQMNYSKFLKRFMQQYPNYDHLKIAYFILFLHGKNTQINFYIQFVENNLQILLNLEPLSELIVAGLFIRYGMNKQNKHKYKESIAKAFIHLQAYCQKIGNQAQGWYNVALFLQNELTQYSMAISIYNSLLGQTNNGIISMAGQNTQLNRRQITSEIRILSAYNLLQIYQILGNQTAAEAVLNQYLTNVI